jgi:TRAP-type uncharacterized transport system substrate-binding protein
MVTAGQAFAYKIASYLTDGGPYSLFAQELIVYLDAFGPSEFVLENYETIGSVQNIQSLYADPEVVLAICQEDVAHFFYNGSNNDFFFVNRETDYRITSLARIFQEEVYLVTQPGITDIDDIKQMFVGEPRSGTYATYTSLRSYHAPGWLEVQAGDRLQLFASGEIDAFLDVASTPNPELLGFGESGVRLRMLSVDRTDLSLGLDIYRPTVVPDSLSPSGEAFRTISVPAVLLADRSLSHEITSLILRVLYDEDVRAEWFPKTRSYLEAVPADLREQDGTPNASDPRFLDLPIPPHPSVVRLTLGAFPYLSFAIGLGVALMAWLVWWQLPRFSSRARKELGSSPKKRLLHRDVSFLFGALNWVFVCAWGIKYLEINQLLRGHSITGSGFVQMNANDVVRWLLVFCTTGYEDTSFPISPTAKILAVSVQIVGLALLTWTGARLISFLVSKLMEKRDMQNLSQIQGHVLVCNWNVHGVRLLEELRNPKLSRTKLKRTIVVLASDMDCDVPVDDFDDVIHVCSEPWDQSSLQRVWPARAESIIILSPRICGDDAASCDGFVYRTALSLQSFFADCPDGVRRPHVIAQVSRPMDETARMSLGIDEMIASYDMGGRLLAQTVTCPGITQFFDEILSCDDASNEIYGCSMPDELVGKPAKFWSVVTFYAEHSKSCEPVLPVGLRLISRSSQEDSDSFRNSQRPAVLLNPTIDELKKIGVQFFAAADEILFLADKQDACRHLEARGG